MLVVMCVLVCLCTGERQIQCVEGPLNTDEETRPQHSQDLCIRLMYRKHDRILARVLEV